MSVVVAYQSGPTGQLALTEAGREATMRGTDLIVINIVNGIDMDSTEATRAGISDRIESALATLGQDQLDWSLRLETARDDDVADAILDVVQEARAELLVIGARRRSPVGKFLLGSVTQSIILDARVPVLTVKS